MSQRFCGNCGNRLIEGALYCAGCGAPTRAAPVRAGAAQEQPVPAAPVEQADIDDGWSLLQPPDPDAVPAEAEARHTEAPHTEAPHTEAPHAEAPATEAMDAAGESPPAQVSLGKAADPTQYLPGAAASTGPTPPAFPPPPVAPWGAPSPGQQPYPSQQAYPGQQTPGQQNAGQQTPGQQPFAPSPPPKPKPAPTPVWQSQAPGDRRAIDSMVGGDWLGALLVAAAAVGGMLALSLIAALLFAVGDATVGFRSFLVFTTTATAAAVGGDLVVGDEGLGAIPLGVSSVGVLLLASLFLYRLGRGAATGLAEAGLQVIRVGVAFSALMLLVALLTRVGGDADDVHAGIPSTIFGALLLSTTVASIAVAARRADLLPGRARRLRDLAVAPSVGALAVYAAGMIAVGIGLVVTLITQEDRLAQLGAAVLAMPNIAISAVLIPLGVPLTLTGGYGLLEGSSGLDLLRDAEDDRAVSLFTLTDESAWWWFAPLVAILVVLLVALAVMLRQQHVEAARREGFRFAGAFALVSFLASVLARVAAGDDARLWHQPLLALVVTAAWGAAAALILPQVAGALPTSLIRGLRRVAGTVPDPAVAPTAPQSPSGAAEGDATG